MVNEQSCAKREKAPETLEATPLHLTESTLLYITIYFFDTPVLTIVDLFTPSLAGSHQPSQGNNRLRARPSQRLRRS